MFGLGPCASLQRDCNNQAALLPAMSATRVSQQILYKKEFSESGVLLKVVLCSRVRVVF